MLAGAKVVCNLANVRDTYRQLEAHPDDEPGRRVRASVIRRHADRAPVATKRITGEQGSKTREHKLSTEWPS